MTLSSAQHTIAEPAVMVQLPVDSFGGRGAKGVVDRAHVATEMLGQRVHYLRRAAARRRELGV